MFYFRTCTAVNNLQCRLQGWKFQYYDLPATPPFLGEIGGRRQRSLLVTRKNEKGLYASQYSARDCVPRTSFDTMASIQVCFLYYFFFLDRYFPVHGLRWIIVTQPDSVLTACLKIILYCGFETILLCHSHKCHVLLTKKIENSEVLLLLHLLPT